MSAVDQLLADADALIEEWDGRSIDAASWTADGSHEIPDVAFVWCRCGMRPVNGDAECCARCEGDLLLARLGLDF